MSKFSDIDQNKIVSSIEDKLSEIEAFINEMDIEEEIVAELKLRKRPKPRANCRYVRVCRRLSDGSIRCKREWVCD